jgi:hypothetical protein
MVKNFLEPHVSVSAGDMSLATITSDVTCIKFLDNLGIQLSWTGSPVGTFDVQVSNDYSDGKGASKANAGTWSSLGLNPPVSASGSAADAYLQLQQICAPYIRVVYTKTSGTGSLTVVISGKAI